MIAEFWENDKSASGKRDKIFWVVAGIENGWRTGLLKQELRLPI